MAILPQAKTGYLRGIRGAILVPLNPNGSEPSSPERYPVKTAQACEVEAVLEEGETATLRGGDRVLARVEDPDVVVGFDLTFRDARFDAKVAQIVAGGQLITVTEGTDQRIVGYVAPTIEEQATRTPFRLEVYVTNFNRSGGADAFLKVTFPFCIGRAPNITFEDQEWAAPEFEVKARENPATGESAFRTEFVSALPPELQ